MSWIKQNSNLYTHSDAPFSLQYIGSTWYLVDNRDQSKAIPFSDIFNNPAYAIDLSNQDVLVNSLSSTTTISAGTVNSGTHLRSEGANTPATPGHSFKNEISSGLYRESAGVLAISVLGSKQLSIDSNGYFLKSNNVAGHFERTTSYSSGAVVAFDTAIINNTNYNTGTGRFTSPVAGTYLFYVQGIGQVSNRIGVYFRKNGNLYTNGISSLNDLNGGTGAQTAIMQLNAGEYMDVYANYPGTFTYSKSCFFGFFLIG